MQVLLILDLILVTFAFGVMLYVILFYFEASGGMLFVVVGLFSLGYIVPVIFAAVFYYFYFKRMFAEGGPISANDFTTTSAYTPPFTQNRV
jgi:hypothetical protein